MSNFSDNIENLPETEIPSTSEIAGEKTAKSETNDDFTQVYDSVFWAVLNVLKRYIPALVYKAFGVRYSDKVQITLKAGKQAIDQPGKGFKRQEEDALINLAEDGKEEDYHFECEARGRKAMAVRIVRYTAGYVAQNVSMFEDEAVIRIPSSAVIFLRSDSTNLKALKIRIEYPGGSVSYRVPVLRMDQFSVEDIFNDDLLLLLPFIVFKFSEDDYAKMDETDASQLKELIDDIAVRLNLLVDSQKIETWEKANLLRYLNETLTKLTTKYKKVQKEVETIMGAYIFKTDVDIAHEEGLNEGLNLGRTEGFNQGRTEGFNQGRTEGQTLLGKLIDKLCSQERYDDVRRSSTDVEYRNKLYKEFQLA